MSEQSVAAWKQSTSDSIDLKQIKAHKRSIYVLCACLTLKLQAIKQGCSNLILKQERTQITNPLSITPHTKPLPVFPFGPYVFSLTAMGPLPSSLELELALSHTLPGPRCDK